MNLSKETTLMLKEKKCALHYDLKVMELYVEPIVLS